ncbi:uncharacterized protein LOC132605995 [Lycium barbarum]|uniref:uncharacterized protein LOC132605995 n=1 Tax=Lycium barbarum TaxID=112863 RepID=UPI00293E3DC5|nr:uncharacterized protein LOC132605995 [Lycium barbarum]
MSFKNADMEENHLQPVCSQLSWYHILSMFYELTVFFFCAPFFSLFWVWHAWSKRGRPNENRALHVTSTKNRPRLYSRLKNFSCQAGVEISTWTENDISWEFVLSAGLEIDAYVLASASSRIKTLLNMSKTFANLLGVEESSVILAPTLNLQRCSTVKPLKASGVSSTLLLWNRR